MREEDYSKIISFKIMQIICDYILRCEETDYKLV